MENNVEDLSFLDSVLFGDPADFGERDGVPDEGSARSDGQGSSKAFDYERDVWIRSVPLASTTGREVGDQRQLGQRAQVLVWEDEE